MTDCYSQLGESCSNNLGLFFGSSIEYSPSSCREPARLTGITHPCGGFLSSQPALMTCVMGVEPPGSPSMGCGGSSGIRRLLGRDEFRLLLCHPPLGKEEKE